VGALIRNHILEAVFPNFNHLPGSNMDIHRDRIPVGMRLLKILALLALILSTAVALGQTAAPLKPIVSLDVPRYLGRWYEIAKFPNSFQKRCVSDTSADYELRPDGSLSVLNQCRQVDAEWEKALGLAKQVGGDKSAKLQVRFAPAWLSFLPFVWGDYWVVDLDEKYELAAVSEPKREYLWILSRTPVVDPSRYAALLVRLNAMGLDTGRLEKTTHLGQ
jgi:apolipoprotein D and lipocalin family protein